MGKTPRGPSDSPSSETPLTRELGRLGRLAGFFRPGERDRISSSVLPLREGDNATLQRAACYADFRRLPNTVQEARFEAAMNDLAHFLVEHGAMRIESSFYEILENLARQKGTNLATILSIITNRPLLREETTFRLLTDAEVQTMLGGGPLSNDVLGSFKGLLRRVLRH